MTEAPLMKLNYSLILTRLTPHKLIEIRGNTFKVFSVPRLISMAIAESLQLPPQKRF